MQDGNSITHSRVLILQQLYRPGQLKCLPGQIETKHILFTVNFNNKNTWGQNFFSFIYFLNEKFASFSYCLNAVSVFHCVGNVKCFLMNHYSVCLTKRMNYQAKAVNLNKTLS